VFLHHRRYRIVRDEGRVKRGLSIGIAGLWLTATSGVVAGGTQATTAPARQLPAASHGQVVTQYCVGCHNGRALAGGLALDGVDASNVSAAPEAWEKVLRKLRTGAMPPQGVKRPDQRVYDEMVGWLEGELDRAAAAAPNPGGPIRLHRLNRAEYKNAIRDLLDLEIDTASLLPPDDSAFGFDNIADALGVSPVLLERYLVAAGKISALAVGDVTVSPSADTYRIRGDVSQDRHVDGLPLGTVGGALVRHVFPVDAEYTFQVKLFRTNSSVMRGLEYPQDVEITIDGQRVFLATVGGGADFQLLMKDVTAAGDAVDARLQVKVPVKAGPRAVAVTFLQKTPAMDSRVLQPFIRSSVDTYDFTGRPHIETFTIVGPIGATGPGDTPSRRRIFECRGEPEVTASEAACAKRILSTLARRAYRGPVTDEDLKPLMAMYEVGRRNGSFDSGIQAGLRRVLASPLFVFRGERVPADVAPGRTYRLNALDLASQLSFFLWSSVPDEELLREAVRGQLHTPSVLQKQVRRMLADPKARALVDNFAGQWLQLRNLPGITPNSEEFPDFDDNLRQAFRQEAELLFDTIIKDDRSVLELLTADYTFVNERLAKHYGIPNVYGSRFRRVPVPDGARRGLLGKGAVLMVTSHSDKTSPVLRGKWILENLLGTPPPPPPANVPPLENNPNAPRTMRQQMEQHRRNPVCANCHKIMDPLGFTLENFDAVGAWRERESGGPVDASGMLTDGTVVDGVVALRQALLKRPEVIVGTFVEKLLTYALGRGLGAYDMPAVRTIVREAGKRDYRFSEIVLGVVNSLPFQMRMKPAEERPETTQQVAGR
jgi:hypothetical protein